MTVELDLNGRIAKLDIAEDTPLLTALRNYLGLTGARFGCGQEQCGACMVLVDGEPMYSCTMSVLQSVGRSVTTLEGLGKLGEPHALQQAFLEEQAGQCGYCLSGMMISAKALLDRRPRPDRQEIRAALEPNLCRCGAHLRILRAIERAAELLARGAEKAAS
ncbi:(2Fe-2S)-binding protein [Bradyrhizobium sp. DASA03007]|uniref:(2Fe-2S)-binding protein n=1 Tax=unclassified Bradyrhizobium TaxID=2631580 RepID=UPI003F6ECF43